MLRSVRNRERLPESTMTIFETIEDVDDVEIVPLALPLDRATISWLTRLSRGNDATAAEFIASIVREVREDDEAAHATKH